MVIGVLALQGAFREHISVINTLGVACIPVRTETDIDSIDGLILPGGESTAMMKLIKDMGLLNKLRDTIRKGLPTWGTCAGMILMSSSHLDVMRIKVVRNAYGNQSGSFKTLADVGDILDYPQVYIRAPYIESNGESVEILSLVDGRIVAAKDHHLLATSFHPELTDDYRLHEYFIDRVRRLTLNCE